MGKRWFRRMAAVVMAVVLGLMAHGDAQASSISSMKAKKKDIDAEIKAISSQLNSTVLDKNNTINEVAMIDTEIEIAQLYYDYYCELMDWAERELAITEEELARARFDYETQFEAFAERVRYMNENNFSDLEYWQILFSSKSITDFLNNVYIINTLIEYDKTVTDRLKEAEELIALRLEEAEAYRLEIEELKIQQEVYLWDLESKMAEKARRLEELYAQEEYFNQMLSDIEDDSNALEKLIKEAEAAELARQKAELERQKAESSANVTQTAYSGGQLGWPVPSSSTISSYYGNRTHPVTKKPDFHKGIDIPAPKGNNVVAAGNGKVIFAGTQGTYGKLVVIDHGGGMSTAYAHNSSITVSVGQSVKKGDVIAKIGSTGQSTGNHCHFEVRVNGATKNPLDYVK